jgi:glycosyltransferase involved in cell wall biosynthesis
MKLVTAIITTHNRLGLLKRAIESVYAQTYKNMELIVVDDASTDGTDDYCRTLPLRYIHIPKMESKGGNHARNLGIKAAKGEYVAFLDDDDYWLPEKIEKQVALIESKDCELVHCGRRLELVSRDGEVTYCDRLPNPLHYGDMHKKILLTVCTVTTNILAKRQALIDVGLFDENLRFWQDYALTIRMAQRKPFYFVNEPLSVYRVDTKDKNRLTNKYEEWKEAVRYIHQKHAALYAKLNVIERIRVRLLVMGDAVERRKSSGLKRKATQLYIAWFILSLPFRVIDKVKKLYVAPKF